MEKVLSSVVVRRAQFASPLLRKGKYRGTFKASAVRVFGVLLLRQRGKLICGAAKVIKYDHEFGVAESPLYGTSQKI